jgi:hypothetical protein
VRLGVFSAWGMVIAANDPYGTNVLATPRIGRAVRYWTSRPSQAECCKATNKKTGRAAMRRRLPTVLSRRERII